MRVTERYRPSMALLTDLYQLTMAYGYWKSGIADREACFHLFFRKHPFGGGYTVTAGLPDALDLIAKARLEAEELEYLGGLESPSGDPLFEPAFLDDLARQPLRVDVDAVPEGTVMFPNEPVMRVSGPLMACQLLETPLLDLINFPSLIATKAARVCDAAGFEPVMEFGLRRAQGPDGALTAARAAYVGGCSSTSNVLAGRLFGIPVKGTHAHSFVMAFDEDEAAFRAWARAMPGNCIFLVDTYDSMDGLEAAIRVGVGLRERGHEMVGVRLDSGDLIELSKKARARLDEAGFEGAAIVASGDLDEHQIRSLRRAGARIGLWGVGTRLTTGHPDPALNGVYKLAAIREADGTWAPRIKLSDTPGKTTIPGRLAVRRYSYKKDGRFAGDAIYDIGYGLEPDGALIALGAHAEQRSLEEAELQEDLLVPAVRRGEVVYEPPPVDEARARARRQLEALPDGVRRLEEPELFFVGLEPRLFERRARMMEERRRQEDEGKS